MEVEIGKTYEVLDASGSCGYFSKGDKVTPSLRKVQTTDGVKVSLDNGAVHSEMVMFAHVTSKNIGLYLRPDQVKLVS